MKIDMVKTHRQTDMSTPLHTTQHLPRCLDGADKDRGSVQQPALEHSPAVFIQLQQIEAHRVPVKVQGLVAEQRHASAPR